jgi:hypothetical protein
MGLTFVKVSIKEFFFHWAELDAQIVVNHLKLDEFL